MSLPYRLLLFALALAVLTLSACDVLAVPDDDPDPPDPPAQTFDDTPVALQQATHETATTVFTVFNTGFQGAATGNSGAQAFSFLGMNGLYEGQLLLGLSDTQVSGQPYSVQAAMNEPNWTEGSALASVRDVGDFEQGFRTRYTDGGSGNPNPLGLTVTQWSYAGGAAEGAVVVVFDIANDGPARDGLYVGLFADFDVFAPDPNRAGYDAASRTLYTFDPTGTNPSLYGVAALSDPVSGWTASLGGIASNITDAVLYTALTTPGEVPTTDGDPRSVIGVGPFRLASGATRRVAFAYVAGTDLADLTARSRAARTAVASLPAP